MKSMFVLRSSNALKSQICHRPPSAHGGRLDLLRLALIGLSLLAASFALAQVPPVLYSDIRDGDLTVAAGTTKLIDDTVTSVIGSNAAGTKILNVASTSGFSVGDIVLVAVSSDPNTNLTQNTAGIYEWCRITGVATGTMTFLYTRAKTFDASAGAVIQVLRVPQYQNVTVNGELTCRAWSGTSGGIVPLVARAVVVNAGGSIHADGKGYRGGIDPPLSGGVGIGCSGEGTTGKNDNRPSTTGEKSYGGGGGGNGYSGGGGGSNGASGGTGVSTSTPQLSGQGASAFGSADLARIYFGGGGGASGTTAAGSTQQFFAPGGNGGGIVMIAATQLSGTGRISCLGQPGIRGDSLQGLIWNFTLSGGGGGAGGSISLAAALSGGLSIAATGGDGGAGVTVRGNIGGNGGVGSVGRIRLDLPTGATTPTAQPSAGFVGQLSAVQISQLTELDGDHDGMPTWWELFYGLNPLDASDAAGDKDGDGVSNLLEYQRGTDPTKKDTDGDGLSDYEEMFIYGTDPVNPDTDSDGMPDGWEVAHGLNPRRNDANEDKDFDFLTNLEEYQAGTDPTKPISGTDGLPDYQKVRGKVAWAASYDKNDRLVGVRYEKQSFGFRYDGNGNLIGQARLGADSDGDGLPDWWEYAHGLNPFSAVGNDGANGDPDGDGWTNMQEFLAGTDPRDATSKPGANGTAVGAFAVPFVPMRFVVGTGQLDSSGSDEFVVGADGDPGSQTNFVRIYSEIGGWTYDQVPIGSYGVTSIAVGQLSGRNPAVYLGLRKIGAKGRIVELTRSATGWTTTLIAESLGEAAYVHGLRTIAGVTDLVAGIAPRSGAEGGLYRVTYEATGWMVASLDGAASHRGTGAIGRSTSTGSNDQVIRLLDAGGIQIADNKLTAFVDEFNDGVINPSLWTYGGDGSVSEANGLASVVVNYGPDKSRTEYLETSSLWPAGVQALSIGISSASSFYNDTPPSNVTAKVIIGQTVAFLVSGTQQNIVVQLVRSETSVFFRSKVDTGPWGAWSAAPFSNTLRFEVDGSANRYGYSAYINADYVRSQTIAAILASGPSPADFSAPEARYRASDNQWYFKAPATLSWLDAQAYANARGCDLVTVPDSATSTWLQGWIGGDFWLGYLRDTSTSPWRWLSGSSATYSSWASGQPGSGADQLFAFCSATGSWSNSAGAELKSGVITPRVNASEVRTSIIAEPSSTHRLQGGGRSLVTGRFNSAAAVQESFIETYIDDWDASSSVTAGDEFVVAELVPSTSGTQIRTLVRRTLAAGSSSVSYAQAVLRPNNAAQDLLVTGEPDGQLCMWTPATPGADLKRQIISLRYVGKSWHALERLSQIAVGDGLLGLTVSPTNPQSADIIVISATDLAVTAAAPLLQTPPSARVETSPSSGGAIARVNVRVWDNDSNPVRLQLQYQSSPTGAWLDATLNTIDQIPAALATSLSSSPGGTDHQLMWNAGANLGATFRGTLAIRVRAADAAAYSDWSFSVPYTIDGAGDADGDGMPDVWESAHGLNPNVNDANGDLDGDGVSNLDEYLQGTDPNDPNSAKYSLTVTGVGATVTKNPDQPLYDKGTTVTVSAVQQPSTLSFIGWAPTAAITGGGYAAAVTTNPLPVVMTSNRTLIAYAGLPLADALDTPSLAWTTGGHALWYGENSTTQDGVDAAQATGLSANGNEAWMETTVTAPGSISWRARLDIANGGGSALQLLVGDVVQDTMSAMTDWTQKIVAVNGAGATKVRWRFVRQSTNAAAINDSAFVDTVAFVAAAKPIITTQPQNIAVGVGGNAGFSVVATSDTPITYRWQRKTAAQADFTDLVEGPDFTNVTRGTVAVNGVVATMNGDQFRCVVSNVSGSVTTNAATLTVIVPPTITAQPQPTSVQVGGEVNFSVTVAGSTPFTYQWRKNGTAISGATNSVLTLTNAQLTDAADYTVQVSNGAGAVPSTAAGLSVLTNSVAPAFTSQPADVTLTIGQTATFAVTVSGLPAPTIQWKKNGVEIAGATAASLTITNAQFSDAGTFVAVAKNVAGTVSSNPASLVVQPLPTAPKIVSQPASQTVNFLSTAVFAVAADGFPPPSYQWRKGGVAIAGATGVTLTVPVTSSAVAGVYTVVVTNSQGFVASDPAVLTIANAPTIAVQPVGQSVSAGANVVLSVAATGDPSPTYQWRRDGFNVVGATSALLILNTVTLAQAGIYTVIVSNSAGSVTSSPATLNVVPPGTVAVHEVLGGGYVAGGTVTIKNTMTFPSDATGLGWSALVPAGWTYAGDTSNGADAKPALGSTEVLQWAWSALPVSPMTFSYTLNVPAGAAGNQQVAALAIVRQSGVPASQLLGQPDPLMVAKVVAVHSADTMGATEGTPPDGKLNLLELLRVIELYNTRNGTVRTGSYRIQDGTEDGFAAEPTRGPTDAATLPRYHSADTGNGVTPGSPPDGKIGLTELLRVIELYNYRSGTVRTGQYHVQAGTEDGFAPGP